MGVVDWFARNRVVRSATSLFGSTGVTSLLGFAFWAVAARNFSMEAVGSSSAAVSLMMLLATTGVLGLGTLMVGEMSQPHARPGIASASLILATLATTALAFSVVGLGPADWAPIGGLRDAPGGLALFAIGAALTGFTMVLDQICIGIGNGRLQFWRNTMFSIVKLLLLVLTPASLSGSGEWIYAAWALGNLVSICSFMAHTRILGIRPGLLPDMAGLRSRGIAALGHHWLNLATQAPRLMLPVVVAGLLSPSTNAAFYTALLISGFVSIFPFHLSVALFALRAESRERVAREVRDSLRLSLGVSAIGALALAVSSPLLMSFLGPDYRAAAGSLTVLALASIPLAVKAHYLAVSRLEDSLVSCGLVMTIWALVEVGCAALAAHLIGGLMAVSVGYLAALLAEAMFLLPRVLRAARMTHV